MVTISRANKSHIKPHHMKIPVKTLLSTVITYLKKMIGPNKKTKEKNPAVSMAMENQYAKHHKNKGKLCNLIPFYRLEYRWANTTH